MTRPEYMRALKAASDAWKSVGHVWETRERVTYMRLAAQYAAMHGVLPAAGPSAPPMLHYASGADRLL